MRKPEPKAQAAELGDRADHGRAPRGRLLHGVHQAGPVGRRHRGHRGLQLGAEPAHQLAGADRGRRGRQGDEGRAARGLRGRGRRGRRGGRGHRADRRRRDDGAQRRRPAAEGGCDLLAAPAPVPRGQPLRRRPSGQPVRARGRLDDDTFPAAADLELRPARRDPHRLAADRLAREPPGPARPVRLGPDRRGRREVAADPEPRRARRLPLHVDRQRRLPRREPARPLRADREPRLGHPRARRQRGRAAGPGHQPARSSTGSFAAQSAPLEQAIQELPNTLDAGNDAFASLNASFPPLRAFAARSCRASAPRRRRSTPLRRCCASSAASPSPPSCAGSSPTCARRCPSSPS